MINSCLIKNIKKEYYSGKVYNLELKSETFSTEKEDQYFIDAGSGIISHNCFPKDLSAINHEFKTRGIANPILNAVEQRNIYIDRQEQDWKELKGRAVT